LCSVNAKSILLGGSVLGENVARMAEGLITPELIAEMEAKKG